MTRRAGQCLRWLAGLALALLGIGGIPGATIAQSSAGLTRLSGAAPGDYVALPLGVGGNSVPVVMLAMSVDEQLHRVAYNDYTDLDGNGVIDPTYADAIDYRGYFDPRLCYDYDDDRFRAMAPVVSGSHRCADGWSGNFLNWVSMSRLDLVRAGLYGGLRVGDDGDGTLLERAYLPPESAAWVKVYRGPAPIGDYTPIDVAAGTPISFCNVSSASTAQNVPDSGRDSLSRPLIRVAFGNFPLWSSTDGLQCQWDDLPGDRPASSAAGSVEYVARVAVCGAANAALRESSCRGYPAAHPTIWRPSGSLQAHGESGQIRFGLISGSYARPRSGGQLRRNAGRLAGHGNDPSTCAAGDEIRLSDGAFCNLGDGREGIINTLNRLRPARYRFDTGSTPTGVHSDCEDSGRDATNRGGSGLIANADQCNGIGNPVAELMAEALRYLSGAATPTAAFDARSTDGDYIPGLPVPAWQDPFAVDALCAECSIVLIGSGSPSFDADELPAIAALDLDAASIAAETRRIGSNEGLDGGLVLAGRITAASAGPDTVGDRCDVRTLAHLDDARGICPGQPGREGSFHVAGLSLAAWTGDLRASDGRQRAQTFALSFGDEIGSIRIPTPGGPITVTPACQFDGLPPRSCALVSMQPGPVPSNRSRAGYAAPYVYGRTIAADGGSGSVMVSWHASAYGFQRDDEITQVLSWCVGSRCAANLNAHAAGADIVDICWRADTAAPSPCAADGSVGPLADDDLLIRTEIITARPSGVAETLGYSLDGAATGNGTTLLVRRLPDFPAGSGQFATSDNLINPAGPGPEPALSDGALSGAAVSWGLPQVRRYRAGGSGRRLEEPLFYAAKYGSFDGSDGLLPVASGDGPCPMQSWDRVNNRTGDAGGDCVPDNFHALDHPGDFGVRLDRLLKGLSRRATAGERVRAGAAISSVGQGGGAVYQARYEPSRSDGRQRVSWTGTLQALFTDRDGQLREDDASRDGLLDEGDYAGHPVVRLFFDEAAGETRFLRYSANPADDADAFTVIDDPDQLRSLWNAQQQLSALANASLASQRPYANPADSGRHLFTFADFNLDGRADDGEQIDLTAANFGAGRYGLLDVGSASQAADLIHFTRGQDGIAGLRPRSLDEAGTGIPQVLRLGDIVNSTPLAVGAPAEAYDLLYGDQSYAAFFRQYRARRHVVYVGANDGMLHAFNAGFPAVSGSGFQTGPSSAGAGTEHPLGSEIWAYVPFNLLPHLGWMADPAYGHVWTMDGSPRAFDVRAFPPDARHPNGWGTILVMSMRLGGRSIRIPMTGDALSDFAAGLGGSPALVTRPAYAILDITDPETVPRLLAEFSHPLLGFTTSSPAVAAFAAPDATAAADGSSAGPDADRWYLMFGNGPDDMQRAEAAPTQTARLFRLDLKALIGGAGPAIDALIDDGPIELASDGSARGFVGDPVTVDWDLNFRADALYVGTSGGTAGAPIGKLFRLDFRNPASPSDLEGSHPDGWRAPAVLLEAGRPILSAPSVTQDRLGNRWVLGGTGRFLADGDRSSSSRQALFGVIDTGGGAIDLASLVDTSAARVTVEGEVGGIDGNLPDGLPATTETRLIDLVAGARGWRFDLAAGAAGEPAERSAGRTALIDSLLFATSFTPADGHCSGVGESRLFSFDFRSGAPRSQRPPFPFDLVTPGADVVGVQTLGKGLATAPTLQLNGALPNGRATVAVRIQSSTGAIFHRDAAVTRAIRSGEIDWRETHPKVPP